MEMEIVSDPILVLGGTVACAVTVLGQILREERTDASGVIEAALEMEILSVAAEKPLEELVADPELMETHHKLLALDYRGREVRKLHRIARNLQYVSMCLQGGISVEATRLEAAREDCLELLRRLDYRPQLLC